MLDGPSLTKYRVADSLDGVRFSEEVYNIGVQIMAQDFDWILLPLPLDDEMGEAALGNLTNVSLKIKVICLFSVALACYDEYFGVGVLPSLLVGSSKGEDGTLFFERGAEEQ